MEIDLRFIGFVESNITRGGLTIFVMDPNLFAAGRHKPFYVFLRRLSYSEASVSATPSQEGLRLGRLGTLQLSSLLIK